MVPASHVQGNLSNKCLRSAVRGSCLCKHLFVILYCMTIRNVKRTSTAMYGKRMLMLCWSNGCIFCCLWQTWYQLQTVQWAASSRGVHSSTNGCQQSVVICTHILLMMPIGHLMLITTPDWCTLSYSHLGYSGTRLTTPAKCRSVPSSYSSTNPFLTSSLLKNNITWRCVMIWNNIMKG